MHGLDCMVLRQVLFSFSEPLVNLLPASLIELCYILPYFIYDSIKNGWRTQNDTFLDAFHGYLNMKILAIYKHFNGF